MIEEWVRNRYTVTDWGEILAGAELPRGIRPSDIDGIIEVNGWFLVLEKKKTGEPESEGQRRMLRALARLPEFTVLQVVHGQDGVESLYDYRTGRAQDSNPGDFIWRVEKWATQADARGPMRRLGVHDRPSKMEVYDTRNGF